MRRKSRRSECLLAQALRAEGQQNKLGWELRKPLCFVAQESFSGKTRRDRGRDRGVTVYSYQTHCARLADRLHQRLLRPFKCFGWGALSLDVLGRHDKGQNLCEACADGGVR
jgi:hypothetical protein